MREVIINEWMSFEDIIKQCEKHFRASNYVETILIPYLEQIGFSNNDKMNIIKYSINAININADRYINNVKKIKETDKIYATYEIDPDKFINGYFLKQILQMPIFKEYVIRTKNRALEYPERLSIYYKNEINVICVYSNNNKVYDIKEINFNYKKGTEFITIINKYLNMSSSELQKEATNYMGTEE